MDIKVKAEGVNPSQEIRKISDAIVDLEVFGSGYGRETLASLARDIEESARKLGNHFEAGGER